MTTIEDNIYALRSVLGCLTETFFEFSPEARAIFLRKMRLQADMDEKHGLSGSKEILDAIIRMVESNGIRR